MSELELNSPVAAGHVPVLIEEVIHALAPVNGAVMVDGTYGGGRMVVMMCLSEW